MIKLVPGHMGEGTVKIKYGAFRLHDDFYLKRHKVTSKHVHSMDDLTAAAAESWHINV